MPDLVLNDSLQWGQLPEYVKQAFKGEGEKVRLEAGYRLYKFSQFDIKRSDGSVSEWWSPVDAFGDDPGLDQRISLAMRNGVDLREIVRLYCAVKESWNALTELIKIEMVVPAYAFWGKASGQERGAAGPAQEGKIEDNHKTRNLPGNACQFYIPNLKQEHIVEKEKLVAQTLAKLPLSA